MSSHPSLESIHVPQLLLWACSLHSSSRTMTHLTPRDRRGESTQGRETKKSRDPHSCSLCAQMGRGTHCSAAKCAQPCYLFFSGSGLSPQGDKYPKRWAQTLPATLGTARPAMLVGGTALPGPPGDEMQSPLRLPWSRCKKRNAAPFLKLFCNEYGWRSWLLSGCLLPVDCFGTFSTHSCFMMVRIEILADFFCLRVCPPLRWSKQEIDYVKSWLRKCPRIHYLYEDLWLRWEYIRKDHVIDKIFLQF